MYDGLPIQQFKANCDAMKTGKPIPYGSMSGQVLDCGRYLDEFNDLDLVLRQNVPAKYAGYFHDPDEADDIEVGRSSSPYKLSPVKPVKTTQGVKESENLLGSVFDADETRYLGKSRGTAMSEALSDNLDEFEPKSKKYYRMDDSFNESSVLDNQVNDAVDELDRAKHAAKLAQAKYEEQVSVNRHLQALLDGYKAKLRKYYGLNEQLKAELANVKSTSTHAKVVKSAGPEKSVGPDQSCTDETRLDQVDSTAEDSILLDEDVASIDSQIRKLDLQRRRVVHQKKKDKQVAANTLNINLLGLPELVGLLKQPQAPKPAPTTRSRTDCVFCHPKDTSSNDTPAKIW